MANIKSLRPFQKGHDSRRNSKGRPKGALSPNGRIRQIISSTLQEPVEGMRDMLKVEYLIRKCIARAMQGNVRMIKLIWEYLDGKPPTYEQVQRQRQREEWRQRQEEMDKMTDKDFIKIAKSILKNSPKEKPKNEEKSEAIILTSQEPEDGWRGGFNDLYSDYRKRNGIT